MGILVEEWKPIPGYRYYQVSSLGNVRSIDREIQCSNRVVRRRGRILKHNRDTRGYLQVCLCDHTKRKTELVHRLVLSAFIGPQPEGMEACHNNGDRTDNRADNLRWDTRSENTRDKMRHGTHNWEWCREKEFPMATPILYSQPGCGSCMFVKKAFESNGAPLTVVNVRADEARFKRLTEDFGLITTPVLEYPADGSWTQNVQEMVDYAEETSTK